MRDGTLLVWRASAPTDSSSSLSPRCETCLSKFGRHFVRTRDLKTFERRLIRLVSHRPGVLNAQHEALFRYATVLARQHTIRTPEGKDVDIAEDVETLRRWMLEAVVEHLPGQDVADVDALRALAPILSIRLERARSSLLQRHINAFGPEHLDDQIRYKKLVFVLGGGGGAGLTHLGLFSMFNEMGLVPDLIVGSSMGAMMGTLRAIEREYDPVATALALPRELHYNAIFKPYTGYSRYGFPGAFHMNLLRLAREVFQKLIGHSTLRFSELPIKMQIVATGIRSGFQLDEERYANAAQNQASSGSIRKTLGLFFKVVRQLSSNPRLLSQVVFGKDELTSRFPVIEAVGFSCAVPGLLHYDVYHDDPETIDPLNTIFEQQQLLRLCDGGVVNNVPSQVAWDSVQRGVLGSRNAFIMAADVFAPISSSRNLIWMPIQQIARGNVLANRPYADYHKTFQSPPSPLQLIINQYSRLKTIIQSSRDELELDKPLIERALKPLPPYGIWLHSS